MDKQFSADQLRLLEVLARTHPDGHVRSRALAVRAVALGHSRQEVARMFPYSPYSIGQWYSAFGSRGAQAFEISPGRGRRSKVDDQQVLACLRRSPEFYGIHKTRWTLRDLGKACPTLAGMSERGILKVINRLGFSYKRGQPWIHSPDPMYEEKKTPLKRRMPKQGKTRQ